jgi:hypothetical protein
VFVTCFNRFEGVGEEMTRGCVLTTFLWGRLHTEREERLREREKENVFPITSPAALQHREKKY